MRRLTDLRIVSLARSRPVQLAIAVLIAASVGCGGDDAGRPVGGGPSGPITVLAASSLTDAFDALAAAFEDRYPEAAVVVSYAASSELATQVIEGAPADVYASADQANMDRVVEAEALAGEPVAFATNRLQIIVESGNPLGISSLDDLARPDVLFVTTAPEVPIGRYTVEVLDAAGVSVTPRSYEENVRAVVGKVMLGEADAGIVYATDVRAAGDRAAGVDIPDDVNVLAPYPIAVTSSSANAVTAEAFVEFVTSDAGLELLGEYGFGAP